MTDLWRTKYTHLCHRALNFIPHSSRWRHRSQLFRNKDCCSRANLWKVVLLLIGNHFTPAFWAWQNLVPQDSSTRTTSWGRCDRREFQTTTSNTFAVFSACPLKGTSSSTEVGSVLRCSGTNTFAGENRTTFDLEVMIWTQSISWQGSWTGYWSSGRGSFWGDAHTACKGTTNLCTKFPKCVPTKRNREMNDAFQNHLFT